MRADAEGFLRPSVDTSKCVNCGVCERACPVLREHAAGEVRAVYAAKATDDALRLVCSSGAVFPLVARQVLSEGGVVFGARWADARTVVHGKAEDEAALRELLGSKYLQSVMGNAYADCRAELRKGRKVLFTGTPCQIAGLKGFLGGDDDNLVTLQVICHAVPSPRVWRRYVDLCERQHGICVREANFRDKAHGWKMYDYTLNGGAVRENWILNPYALAFLTELCNRPSCADCRARGLKSGADLTVGDFWFVWDMLPEMDDDKGTSVVIVQTEKGSRLLEAVRPSLVLRETDYAAALRGNPSLEKDGALHPRRREFLERVETTEDFGALVTEFVGKDPLKLRHLADKDWRAGSDGGQG